MHSVSIRDYAVVTGSYWAFTITDGALRMLVLLHFHALGYDALSIALLFLLYELFGVVTNLLGGWIASHTGLRLTLFAGLILQIIALFALAQLDPGWSPTLSVAWAMGAQALSGIAKDLTKMSAKSAIKLVVPEGTDSLLYKWVGLLTGSKNALKGLGFFIGGVLLGMAGFANALYLLCGLLVLALAGTAMVLPGELGRARVKQKFRHLLAKDAALNQLSLARLFLFGARDIWFVVGLPLYLANTAGWSHGEIGGYLAAWIIGYGIVQSLVPGLVRRGSAPTGRTALYASLALAISLLVIIGLQTALAEQSTAIMTAVITIGLILFGIVFAVNSAVHSYLVLAYSQRDGVSADVGFYYMANAAGRLVGTLLSGVSYVLLGMIGCLVVSLGFVLISAALAARLPIDR
ncbi:MAG: organoarsenical effux MFS transporter ArsJ [Granulosicoccaceae bacterium]|jgi:MFS family permease